MVGSLVVTGKGQIGDLADGWTVQEDATPLYLNAASGSVGSVGFNGVRDTTTTDASEWAINNTATFTHTNESNPATGLGTISGIIDRIKTSGLNANGNLSSIVDNLSVIRTAPTVGNYTKPRSVIGPVIPTALTDIGSFKGPKDIAFDSTGNMFVFDGYNCRVVKLTKTAGVWQQTAYTSSGYNAGTGNGQFTDSGTIGAAGFIALDSSDNVFVTDTLGLRVQKFNNSLVYQSQFGTGGSGNGQFSSPTGIAIDSSNNIYVADSGSNERIQKFNSAGTYVTQWGGTFGTGNSQFSNLIEGVTVLLAGDILVCDGAQVSSGVNYGARLQRFTNTGTYVSQFGSFGRQAGQFSVTAGAGASVSTGPFDSVVDPTGNIYVLDSGNNRVQVFTSAYVYIGSFGAFGGTVGSFSSPRGIGRSPITGNVWVGDFANNRLVEFQPATLSSPAYTFALSGVYQSYVNLALTGYTVNYIATSNPQVNYPSWTDNVWTKLNQLASANGHEIAIVAGVITVRDIGSLSLSVTEAAIAPEITVTSANSAQTVDITYQNTTYGDGVEFYNAALASQTFSIASGATTTTVVNTNNYPNVINNPAVVDSPYGPGMYQVLAAGNLPVLPSDWIASGASITVTIGATPSQLSIKLRGPSIDISGYPGPYQIANIDTNTGIVSAALSITGSGALTRPTTLHLQTGADPAIAATQTLAVSPDNIFLSTEAQAYDRGVWATDIVGGPAQTISVTIPVDQSSGFGLNAGSLITYNNCTYRIDSATINNSGLQMTGTRKTTSGQEVTLWATRTAGDHATFWSGHPAEDATIAPLLN